MELDAAPSSLPPRLPPPSDHNNPTQQQQQRRRQQHHVAIPCSAEPAMKTHCGQSSVPMPREEKQQEEAALMRGASPPKTEAAAAAAQAVKEEGRSAAYDDSSSKRRRWCSSSAAASSSCCCCLGRRNKAAAAAEAALRRGGCGCCIIGCAALTLVLVGVMLALALALLQGGRAPRVRIRSVELRGVRVENVNATELAELVAEGGRLNASSAAAAMAAAARVGDVRAMSVGLELGLELGVFNPNRASFRHSNASTLLLLYRGMQVGQAAIPAGSIGARSWEWMSSSMTLNASGAALLSSPHLLLDVAAGSFPMSAVALVSGRLNFLHLFEHHARSSTRCSMSVSLAQRAVQHMLCTYRLHL